MARFTGNCEVIEATIAAGATGLSGAIDLGGNSLFAIYMPAAWETANLTLLAAPTIDSTYQAVYDDNGSEVTIVAAASRAIVIDAAALKAAQLRFIKLRSGTAATPVDQTASRTIKIICKA